MPLLRRQGHTAAINHQSVLAPALAQEPPGERVSLQPFEAADRIVGGLSTWTQREYLWAPGGGGGVADGYVDELLAQVTRYGRLLYSLIDANYNVVAVCRDPNDPNASIQPIAEQYVWSPWGEPLAVEVLDPAAGGGGQPAGNRIGPRSESGAGHRLISRRGWLARITACPSTAWTAGRPTRRWWPAIP